MISKINGKLFADMIIQGAQIYLIMRFSGFFKCIPCARWRHRNYMNLTITSGREEVENNLSQSIGELGKTFSKDYLWVLVATQVLFYLNYLEVSVKISKLKMK